jgi:hypothetical protein
VRRLPVAPSSPNLGAIPARLDGNQIKAAAQLIQDRLVVQRCAESESESQLRVTNPLFDFLGQGLFPSPRRLSAIFVRRFAHWQFPLQTFPQLPRLNHV